MYGRTTRLVERKNLELARIPDATYPAPTVTSCAPSSLDVAGGDAATVTGTGFRDDLRGVYFGGVLATSIAVISANSLTCVTPAHVAGAVTIHVKTAGGFGRLANGATYVASASADRVTESGDQRVTESGDRRVTE